MADIEVGRVHNVWFNDEDGWYWCDGVLTSQNAIDLINDGYSVSCSYNVSDFTDKGGTVNNIKYDMEFLDGVFTHLAIVNNPRYEDAEITVINSTSEEITPENAKEVIEEAVKPLEDAEVLETVYYSPIVSALAEVIAENCIK